MNLISFQTLTGCFLSLDSQLGAQGFTVNDALLRNSNMLESTGAPMTGCQKMTSPSGAHYVTGHGRRAQRVVAKLEV